MIHPNKTAEQAVMSILFLIIYINPLSKRHPTDDRTKNKTNMLQKSIYKTNNYLQKYKVLSILYYSVPNI